MEKINIRPTTAIYDSYERLNYTPSTAILEFIDNSIASYEEHKEKLAKAFPDYKLRINIVYEEISSNQFRLKIRDNAFGMNNEDIFRAARLQETNPNNNIKGSKSLNRYGFGLKTASFWFGKKLSLKTTQLNSDKLLQFTFDAKKLKANPEIEEIDCISAKMDKSEHYTEIILENLIRKLDKREFKKMINSIGQAHCIRLQSDKIEIRLAKYKDNYYWDPSPEKEWDKFNSLEDISPLVYSGPELWKNLESGQPYKWEIFDSFGDESKHYSFRGWIGISRTIQNTSGIMLAWKNRMVQLYTPEKLKKYNPYRRIIGFLNSNSWPVTNTKDNISWEKDMYMKFNSAIENFLTQNDIMGIADKLKQSDETKEPLNKNANLIQAISSDLSKQYKKNADKLKLTKYDSNEKDEIDFQALYFKKKYKFSLKLEEDKNPSKIFKIQNSNSDCCWKISIFINHSQIKLAEKKKMRSWFINFLIWISQDLIFQNNDEEIVKNKAEFFNRYFAK